MRTIWFKIPPLVCFCFLFCIILKFSSLPIAESKLSLGGGVVLFFLINLNLLESFLRKGHHIIQNYNKYHCEMPPNILSDSPWGSSRRGICSSCSARWNASSRFSWLLLDWTSERSTNWGLREDRMARKTSPLLQLDLKSFTLTEQWTLERGRQGPQPLDD